ncbi:hypothetical protein OPW07_24240 [Vibrio europaeus]|uniref:hypothetical protein n=1 Tax=Vibrio europaeus TaxID=300876 RepID=UPI0018A71B5A|nr:hypothetical protein [Vibrio europaeus]MDC5812834.1 hypothetical protein [Vibrio europaeus]QPG37628.1 hypothetical protein IXK98_15075 [Vibrio europaeus]
MKYKHLSWDDYQPYSNGSEEIYLTINESDHRVGLINREANTFTLRDGIDLGVFEVKSEAGISYIDRATVEPKMLLATTRALAEEELGADLSECFESNYEGLCRLVENEIGAEIRPAIHLPSDPVLLTLIRQIKQAKRVGEIDEASAKTLEFIDVLTQCKQAEPTPTGVKELARILFTELGVEFEPEDEEDKAWLAKQEITEAYQQVGVKGTRPRITPPDSAYQSILKNLHQAEVELHKAQHMSRDELIAQTLRLVK